MAQLETNEAAQLLLSFLAPRGFGVHLFYFVPFTWSCWEALRVSVVYWRTRNNEKPASWTISLAEVLVAAAGQDTTYSTAEYCAATCCTSGKKNVRCSNDAAVQ